MGQSVKKARHSGWRGEEDGQTERAELVKRPLGGEINDIKAINRAGK